MPNRLGLGVCWACFVSWLCLLHQKRGPIYLLGSSLALAVHNLGILGKLMAETVEDIEPARAAALRGLGAGRAQIALTAVLPEASPTPRLPGLAVNPAQPGQTSASGGSHPPVRPA